MKQVTIQKKEAEVGPIKYLLEYLGHPKEVESQEDFFANIYHYFFKCYRVKSLNIIAIPVINGKAYKNNDFHTRLIWFHGKKRPSIHLPAILKKVKTCKKNKGLFSESGKYHFFFCLGSNNNWQYYLDASGISPKKVNPSVFEYTVKYLESMFEWSNRLMELNKIKGLVHIDDVSGLFNQRKLSIDLKELISAHRKSKGQFSVLFIDIDHFKVINDNYGHVTGTKILAEMATAMKNRLRDNDLVYRYGGDEFVMALPNIGAKLAKKIATRILDSIRSAPIKIEGGMEFPISVSIGIANYPRDASSSEEILSIADRMMYEAKRGGRGRVCDTGEVLGKKKKSLIKKKKGR